MALKFDDCVSCRHRGKPICRSCDFGEYYESKDEISELSFEDDDAAFSRSSKSLVTEDDEPNFNPDDLIGRMDQREEDGYDDE